MNPKPDWHSLRAEFPLLTRLIYLNACSLGPLPRGARAALEKYAAGWDSKGTPVWFSEWMPGLVRLRSRLEELLHAPAGSVALNPSVSAALTTMASCLPMNGRRKVLVGALDFPTVGHQFLSRPELEVEFVPSDDGVSIPPAAFIERIDSSVGLVATTHLFYTTGYVQDVRPIADAAHAAGALMLVDGYQSVGCLPVDVDALGCDVFIAGCLKWLSGGPGTAFTYVRPELIARLRPQGTGWFATRDPFSFTLEQLDFAADARRFEAGTWAVPAHLAALAALELILEVGVPAICDRLRDFSDRILERCTEAGIAVFTPRERERRVGVVTVRSDAPEQVEARLLAAGVVVDSRPGRVRLSPHWALGQDQLERGLELLLEELRAQAGASRQASR